MFSLPKFCHVRWGWLLFASIFIFATIDKAAAQNTQNATVKKYNYEISFNVQAGLPFNTKAKLICSLHYPQNNPGNIKPLQITQEVTLPATIGLGKKAIVPVRFAIRDNVERDKVSCWVQSLTTSEVVNGQTAIKTYPKDAPLAAILEYTANILGTNGQFRN